MNIVIFLLLVAICLGIVYLVHKYFGKKQFYIIGIIYSILGFILSFKLTNILGVDINIGLIFSSGLLLILYYFVNRYSEKESRRFIFTILGVSLICACFLISASIMMPSIYDTTSIFYQTLVLDNLVIVILYPLSTGVTMFLSEYCFREIKREEKMKIIKTILTIFGLIFIDVALFIYFSYAFIIRYDTAIEIAIDNYLVKVSIMIIYILIINRLFMVRKVK